MLKRCETGRRRDRRVKNVHCEKIRKTPRITIKDVECLARVWLPIFLTELATAYAELNQLDDAWRSVHDALTTIERTNERWCEAEVNRVAGEIILKGARPDTGKALACFECALAIARKQRAKSWELRAAMSMARLCHDEDKLAEARDLLTPVYSAFTEGFDTLDLKEAKKLLDHLG
jgi:predicted ATPase